MRLTPHRDPEEEPVAVTEVAQIILESIELVTLREFFAVLARWDEEEKTHGDGHH